MSMQSTDPIADLLTRIRNAILVGKTEVRVPASKLKRVVANELQKAGYVHKVDIEQSTPQATLVVMINQPGTNAKITEIKRLSKPGRRVYAGASDIPRVKSGRGIVLVSTSKGVITGREAVKQRLGGELLLEVY